MVRIVRFHSSQDRTNQSTAMNVFQIINHKIVEVQVAEEAQDLVVEEAQEVDLVVEEAQGLTEGLEKCTKRPAGIVVRIVRFHSSQDRTNQSTAMNVFQIINQQEIKKSLYYNYQFY